MFDFGSIVAMQCAIVIPARMASTRFPGKPLCDLCGKPMIRWVYDAAIRSGVAETVIVASPDDEILSVAQDFGAQALKTRSDHLSGTDRIAEVAEEAKFDFYVNVQGDEPLIDPASIQACAKPLSENLDVSMASVFAVCPEDELDNPTVVKVVTDGQGFALYFSRYSIPYPRNPRQEPVKKHIGIYAYRRDVLLDFARWQPTPLERAESLEQLRFIENGVRIKMSEGKGSMVSVDTPEQADQVRELIRQGVIG
jgi:3-deoxy-manno-octulosonate cytidylyltransferase (CMP-KDO synthetase)